MARKNIQEINNTSNQDHQKEVVAYKKRMPIIRCICGSEILVVPDLKAMSIAIKTHIAEHKKEIDGSDSLDWLEQFLTEQVLIVASEINLPNEN